MPRSILQELDTRINRLKNVENKLDISEEEKKHIQSRRLELESLKGFIGEQMEQKSNKAGTRYDFWKLIDEF